MDNIPIDRLTALDVSARPGGLTALIVIILILLAIVINQVRVIKKTELSGVLHRGWPRRPCYLSAPGARAPNTPLHYCDCPHAWDRVPHPTIRELSRFLARNVPERSHCVRPRLIVNPSDHRSREFRSSILVRYLQLADSMPVSLCSFGAMPLTAQTCPSS